MRSSPEYPQRHRKDILPEEDLFRIVSQDGQRHLLHITLAEGKTIYFKGKIVYTTDYSKQKEQMPIIFSPFALLNFPAIFNELNNTSKKSQIIGTTHPSLEGPILIIDQDIYGESFYINYMNIVASTVKVHSQPPAEKLHYLRLFQLNENKVDGPSREYKSKKTALQSSGPIIEKYLGQGQTFILFDAENLLAYSKSIAVEVIDKPPARMVISPPVIAVSFKGPGWLFFTTKLGSQRRNLRKVASFNIFLAIVLLGLVLMLFLPLF